MNPDAIRLPPRDPEGHKGTFGTCQLIGGSVGMGGALILAGRAALRSGVGLVRLACPRELAPGMPGAVPEATCLGLPSEEGALSLGAVSLCLEALGAARAFGIGPGLSQRGSVSAFVGGVLEKAALPCVVDADGLNVLAPELGVLEGYGAPLVLTPHPGEAARLLGWGSGAKVQEDREGAARALAERTGAVVVLKGARTIVREGAREWVSPIEEPGLAKGGSGDVLTGLVTGLLAQGMEAFEAARLGVWVHGRAGQLAAGALHGRGMTAGDLPGFFGEVYFELEGRG
ncbi:MAG TPA: NAD(P)H-hydrate dehydratase [Planctomycetes bacterium]|nr:NAD(P)H-hydrate dehydratase [Planctomycetota bacterium]